MKDPAVAAVVGVMLVLVIVVSLLAVLNTTTIPDLKAQAEVGHVREVEEGFARLSAALSGIASGPSGSSGTFAIPLGGGEVPLNTLRSSGTLFVTNDTTGSPAVTVTVNETKYEARLVTVGYRPTVHFWVDQGYNWSLGYVTVTKGDIETPLEYRDDSNIETSGHWERFRRVILPDENPGKDGNLTLTLTSFEPGNQTFTSGNGVGSIRYSVHDEPAKTFQPISMDVRVNQTLPEGLRDALGRYLTSINGTWPNVSVSASTDGTFTYSFDPVNRSFVSVNRRVVSLSAG